MHILKKSRVLIPTVAILGTAVCALFSHTSVSFGQATVTITGSDSYTVTYADGSSLSGVGDQVGAGTGWTQSVLENYYNAYSSAQSAINSTAAAIAGARIGTGIDETASGDVLSVSCTNGGTLSLVPSASPPVSQPVITPPSCNVGPICSYVQQGVQGGEAAVFLRGADCSQTLLDVCPNGCSNGQCITAQCSSECTGPNVAYNSCTGTTYCPYGCLNGACLPGGNAPQQQELIVNEWQVSPFLVQSGETTSVSWSVSGATSCTVSGTNGDSWTGLSGNETSSPIYGQTVYSLLCKDQYGPISKSSTVKVVPTFQEK